MRQSIGLVFLCLVVTTVANAQIEWEFEGGASVPLPRSLRVSYVRLLSSG
ncbi:MAG: hypothetical protein AAF517_15850 [Planctomycetota bacterium]